jgi:hypothetical protein
LDEHEAITVLAACGQRPNVAEGIWYKTPSAPKPENCDKLERHHDGDTIHEHVDNRIARGMFGFSGAGEPSGDKQTLLWAGMSEVEHDAGALEIVADYMPSALGNVLGKIMSYTCLDNTLRSANHAPSEWILCENQSEYVGDGFGYGRVNMWSESGILLATASQSLIVRLPDWSHYGAANLPSL